MIHDQTLESERLTKCAAEVRISLGTRDREYQVLAINKQKIALGRCCVILASARNFALSEGARSRDENSSQMLMQILFLPFPIKNVDVLPPTRRRSRSFERKSECVRWTSSGKLRSTRCSSWWGSTSWSGCRAARLSSSSDGAQTSATVRSPNSSTPFFLPPTAKPEVSSKELWATGRSSLRVACSTNLGPSRAPRPGRSPKARPSRSCREESKRFFYAIFLG